MAYCTALPHQMSPLLQAELDDADLMIFGAFDRDPFEDWPDGGDISDEDLPDPGDISDEDRYERALRQAEREEAAEERRLIRTTH